MALPPKLSLEQPEQTWLVRLTAEEIEMVTAFRACPELHRQMLVLSAENFAKRCAEEQEKTIPPGKVILLADPHRKFTNNK